MRRTWTSANDFIVGPPGLREAKRDLVGLAIFDRLEKSIHQSDLKIITWQRREIENYLCSEEALLNFAKYNQRDDMIGEIEAIECVETMAETIKEVTRLLELDDLDPWSHDVKASDQVLDRIFRAYYRKLEAPLGLRKSDYHILARMVRKEDLDPEITEKLDEIVKVASSVQANNN